MKKRLVFIFMVMMIVRPSFALSPTDAAYWSMNRAVSGSTQSALASRGYIPSDPRTYATLQGMSNVAGSSAAVVTGALLAGATAPGWVGVAMVAGLSSAVGYAVTLGFNAILKWLFNSDNTISSTTGNQPSDALSAGQSYWDCSTYFGSSYTVIYSCFSLKVSQGSLAVTLTDCVPTTSPSLGMRCIGRTASGAWWSNEYVLQRNGSPYSCPAGNVYSTGTSACVPEILPPATSANKTLQQAISEIPAQELTKPLNPTIVAATANQLWKQAAAQPGYTGFPYPQANPITATEAQTWQQANPTLWPTVSDFVSPKQTTTTDPTGFALPSDPVSKTVTPTTQTNPNVTNPGSTNPVTNLGPDPGTAQPTLEPTPTAHQILSPLLNLMPDMRSFQVPGHSGQCPIPEFDVWSKHFKMDLHCTLIQNNAGTIQATFALVWAVLALFIVLAA